MEKSNRVKVLLSILFFGAIWAIVEATLGTILHLPAVKMAGVWGGSTTITVPIAFTIMGLFYKNTKNPRGIIYMGILVAGIKAAVCGIFALSFRPCAYILLESLALTGAVALIKPKEVISWKMLGCFALANTVYLLSASFINFAPFQYGSSKWFDYVVVSNLIALMYSLVAGLICFGFKRLFKNHNLNLNSAILKPYIPVVLTAVAVVCTIVLR